MPATTIATATASAAIGSKTSLAGDHDEAEADEDADRGERVGAQVGGVALERGGSKRPSPAAQVGGDAEVRDRREADHREAHPEVLDLGAHHQAMRRLVDDDRGADEDQHPLDRRRQVLGLLVAVGVLAVGRLVGLADRDEGDHRCDEVDGRVRGLGEDRDRARDRPGGDLQGDQQRVRDHADGGRAGLGALHDFDTRTSASLRAARPRWLIACFSSGSSSAIVRSSSGPVSAGTNAGS